MRRVLILGAAGAMGPKVEAACRFIERTGGFAAIGALEQASAILAGTASTGVRKTCKSIRYHE